MTRHPARALLAVVLLAGLTACGGDDATPSVDGPVAAGITPGATLLGEVGTKDKPEAFEITLKDMAGANVTTLPAGDYTIKVTDHATIHNFALSGDGVSDKTDVAGTGESTFKVSLKVGTYTFVCDPHPSMKGAVTVT